ncbi:hypothetical protein ACMD2_19094 [Ananas comosus]|uniref:TFIIS N-terminal domain-containing protein n=1 Tax=Ananas comosus TaxID=4615 RepID=A0A199UID0_ANACO|nr:hypothetical protein ACMD2_19094 [Ananas comosus]
MLGNFFTTPEMNDGIATITRVEELVCEIKKLKDCVSSNLHDALKQWSAVAGTLAVTENKECLNHFVQLNGLNFLNQWFQEAQKCSTDIGDNFSEELINSLLKSLERLPLDNERLASSGIRTTLEQLLVHNNTRIKEKVRTLCGKWSQLKDNSLSSEVVSKKDPESSQPPSDIGKDSTPSQVPPLPSNTTIASNACQDNLSIAEESSASPAAGLASSSSCSSQVDKGKSYDVPNGVKEMQIDKLESDSGRTNERERCSVAPSSSLSSSIPAPPIPIEQTVLSNSDLDSRRRNDSCTGAIIEPRSDNAIDQSKALDLDSKRSNDSCTAAIIEPRSDNAIDQSKAQSPEFFPTKEASESDSDSKDLCETYSMTMKRLELDHINISSEALEAKATESSEKKLKLDTDYEDIDALEVARQVAIEVEKEVVDYREALCSSPDARSGDAKVADTFDLKETKQDEPVIRAIDKNELPGGGNASLREDGNASLREDGGSGITENISSCSEKHEADLESPKLNSAKKFVGESGKDRCGFDLNANICNEENDLYMKPASSLPIHVAASRGAPLLPITRIHFEGEQGWKGTAATSAFRPASPRRTPDDEKATTSLKQKANFVGIDLNVTEGEDDSSTEVISSTEEWANLDLNRLGTENFDSKPAVRDFDLNDNLMSLDSGDSNEISSNASVITLMGAKLTVDKKGHSEKIQQPPFLGNERHVGPTVSSVSMPPYTAQIPSVSVLPYTQIFPPGYPMTTPVLYGPQSIPFMFDSRGNAIVPQVIRGPLGGPLSTMPPFFPNYPSNLEEFASLRRGPDLNSGTVASLDGVSRDFLLQGHSGMTQEPMRGTLHPTSTSGMAVKRKEPECGWEPYVFGHKQVTSRQ